MKQAKIRISQCMIVKNEEKNIEKALSWGGDIVYEQIVVDTGSQDRTAELAKQMGAKVFHYTWIDDFAAAKNYAIEQAQGIGLYSWMQMNFSEEDTDKLMPFLQKIHLDQGAHAVRTPIAHLGKDGNVIAVAPQIRIFRNDPKIRYRYRIHEELYYSGNSLLACVDADSEMMILHTGYIEEEKTGKNKGERNGRLLRKQLEETPNDGKVLMYLGDACNMSGQKTEAAHCYREVLWNPEVKAPDNAVVLRAGLQLLNILIGMPEEEAKEEYFHTVASLRERDTEEHPDIDYMEGLWRLRDGEVDKAAALFENALHKMEIYRSAEVTRISSGLELICTTIAQAALQKKEAQKAVSFAVTALRTNRYSPDGLCILLKAFLTEWKPGMSAEPYWQFLCKIYDSSELKDLLFLHRFSGQVDFSALQERILQEIPPDAREFIGKEETGEGM